MIDFDLIQQTVTEVVGWKRPFWFTLVLYATGALVILMALNNVTRMKQFIEFKMDLREGLREPEASDPIEYPFSKVIWLMCIGVILGPLAAWMFGAPATIVLGTQALVLLIAAGCVLIEMHRQRGAEETRPRNKARVYITTPHHQRDRRAFAKGIEESLLTTQGFGLALLATAIGLLLNGVIDDEPVEETKPTTVAMALSQQSYHQVIDAVTDGYDVEIASKSACEGRPAKIPDEVDAGSYGDIDEEIQEHYDRVQFLKKAVSSDFSSNPQLLLKTPNGIVTCYTVQYDQSDGTATLLVSDENVDAVAPGSLKKD